PTRGPKRIPIYTRQGSIVHRVVPLRIRPTPSSIWAAAQRCPIAAHCGLAKKLGGGVAPEVRQGARWAPCVQNSRHATEEYAYESIVLCDDPRMFCGGIHGLCR